MLKTKILKVFAITMFIAIGAWAQVPKYVITGSVVAGFTATLDGGGTIGTTVASPTSVQLTALVTNIANDAAGRDCEIQLGLDGLDELDLGGLYFQIPASANWGDTVRILGKITSTSECLNIPAAFTGVVDCKANLRGTGTVNSTSPAAGNASTAGTLIFSDGIVTSTAVGGPGGAQIAPVVRNSSTGTIIVTGTAHIKADAVWTVGADGTNAIRNYSTGTVIINGGKVESTNNASTIYNASSGQIIISDSAIVTSNGSAGSLINLQGSGLTAADTILRVTGGTLSRTGAGTNLAINNNTNGVVKLTGGDISSTSGHAVNNLSTGSIVIGDSATIKSTAAAAYGVHNNSTGTINIYGGDITSPMRAVNNNAAGTINVNDSAKITATNASGYGIYSGTTGSNVVLGGSPDITGRIYGRDGVVSIASSFSPATNIYNLELAGIANDAVAIKGGKDYFSNFNIVNSGFGLAVGTGTNANDIIVKTTYNVTYDLNGGTGTTPTETAKVAGEKFAAATFKLITPPVGKIFKEWNTLATGTGASFAQGAEIIMPAVALTLFAIYKNDPELCEHDNTACDTKCSKCEENLIKHTWGDWDLLKPTCDDNGFLDAVCKVCGHDESMLLPKINCACVHNWSEIPTTEPTCDEKGWEAAFCNLCGSFDVNLLDKLTDCCEHEWGEWGVIKAATCEADGYEGQICTLCGAEGPEKLTLEAISHDWGAWEKIADAYCGFGTQYARVCANDETHVEYDEDDDAPGEHDYAEYDRLKPTCDVTGTSYLRCNICEHEKEEVLPVLTDCGEPCVHDNTACGTYCSICEENYVGHDWGEWGEVLAPTCESEGYKAQICNICGEEVENSPIDALGHEWGEWEQTATANCLYGDEFTRVCVRECTEYDYKGEPTGIHAFGESVVVPATCDATGTSTKMCSVCEFEDVADLAKLTDCDKDPVWGDSLVVVGDTIFYTKPMCDAKEVVIVVDGVTYKIPVANKFGTDVRVPNAVVINGKSYTLSLNNNIPALVNYWGGVLTAINNPANNGGFIFSSFEWYKVDVTGEKSVILPFTGQSTEGKTLEAGWYFVIVKGKDAKGNAVEFKSCEEYISGTAEKAAPMLIKNGNSFIIDVGSVDGNELDVYNTVGTKIAKVIVAGKITQIDPQLAKQGHLFVLKDKNGVKTIVKKVVVK